VLLLLETGLKKEELFELRTVNFDLSNRYAPELWVKHTGKKVNKDRKLKLPAEIVPVYEEYVGGNMVLTKSYSRIRRGL
jgi:integrase